MRSLSSFLNTISLCSAFVKKDESRSRESHVCSEYNDKIMSRISSTISNDTYPFIFSITHGLVFTKIKIKYVQLSILIAMHSDWPTNFTTLILASRVRSKCTWNDFSSSYCDNCYVWFQNHKEVPVRENRELSKVILNSETKSDKAAKGNLKTSHRNL